MDEIINVVVTADNAELLDRIGRALLETRLISCIQVLGPIASTYRWKGNIESTREWMGIMKTRRKLYPRVQDEILRLHPYETPQIEVFEAADVSPAYREWVIAETKMTVADLKSP